jgi:hypothetical protein
MIAPVQRRPMSSLARWKRVHNSGVGLGADGLLTAFVLDTFSLDTWFIYKV